MLAINPILDAVVLSVLVYFTTNAFQSGIFGALCGGIVGGVVAARGSDRRG